MLRSLSIRDFVIVDQLELDFGSGFGALTGETGAGKSILLDALGLALGGRGEAGMVRVGRERADVIAEFDLPEGDGLRDWLANRRYRWKRAACCCGGPSTSMVAAGPGSTVSW